MPTATWRAATLVTLARAMAADPQGRHHPDPAAPAQPLDALCAHAAIRRARLRPDRRRGPCRLAWPRRQLLGPQRDHPRPGLRRGAGLPELKGRKPFGGHILSHDFVEAALMRRGRLGGLHAAVARAAPMRRRRPISSSLRRATGAGARAICSTSRSSARAGLHWVSRIHLLQGIMSYLASPFWLLLLLSGLGALGRRAIYRAQLFPGGLLALPGVAGLRSRACLPALRPHHGRALRAEAPRHLLGDGRSRNAQRAAAAPSASSRASLPKRSSRRCCRRS